MFLAPTHALHRIVKRRCVLRVGALLCHNPQMRLSTVAPIASAVPHAALPRDVADLIAGPQGLARRPKEWAVETERAHSGGLLYRIEASGA